MQEKEIGKISHYYNHLNVGIIELSDVLRVGETIHIKGHTSDFTQGVDSMQVEHLSVSEAKAGESIGIKVVQAVHVNDKVFRVEV